MKIITNNNLNHICIFTAVLMLSSLVQMTFGQPINQTQNKADQTLRGNARVNPSTLGMEFSIPIGGYVGRAGNTKPLTLNYSSKVWNTWLPDTWETQTGTPVTDIRPLFAKGSFSGWTTSLQAPRIEFSNDFYDSSGRLVGGDPYGFNYIKRVKVIMPDGAAYDLRQDDNLYVYLSSVDYNGTYLSVDGSKMRLDVNSPQSVLYFPDGGRMFFDNNETPSSYIDANGNKITYTASTKQWTDTLGRVLTNPLQAGQGGTFEPTEGTQVYQFPGYNGQNQQVELIWAKLSTQQPSPAYMTRRFCLSFQDKNLPIGSTILFTISGIPTNACDPFTTPFDPIVLTKVRFQNGSAYKFHYNLYVEIDKIEYPTGGYERFEYEKITPIQSAGDGGYDQFNRGVKKRWVSSDGTTASEVLWKYDVTRVNQELPTDYYKIRITAPNNSYTERYLYDQDSDFDSPFGFSNIAIGRPYDERAYSTTGQLIRKKLTKYTNTGVLSGGYSGATRDLRQEKEILIIFEPGESYALASMTETVYDTTGNSDPAYFSSGNPKQSKAYNYVVVSAATATDATITTAVSWFSTSNIATITETDYLYDSNYKTRNISGLVTETRVKDALGNIKAKSQISYDEGYYYLTSSGTMPAVAANSWLDPVTELGSTLASKRGLPTTVKSYYDLTNNYYIEKHSFYDQFGNLRKALDGRGNGIETQYDDDYAFAYPTKVITPIPGGNGSLTAFETLAAYDFNTGLTLTLTNDNGQITEMEYNDVLHRLTKVTAPNGHKTITEYGTPDSSGVLLVNQRFVKVKTQIDSQNWKEAYTWFDGIGRNVKTQSVDSSSDDLAETVYDEMGRVWKVTNPYRTGETVYWTETTYDGLGRVTKIKTPDNAEVNTTYSLATLSSQIGTVVTVEDQADKSRRSITNALGQLIRVDEPNDSNQLGTISSPNKPTLYNYDVFNNLVQIQQDGTNTQQCGGTTSSCSQTRTFFYDSLSRLIQATNPESGTVTYQYDANGNLLSKIDARSIQTIYSYDNLNRIQSKDYSDTTQDATYYYDNLTNAKGKLIKVDNGFSKTEYTEFDLMGRIKKSKQTTDGTAYNEMEYTYNLSGDLIEEKYPSTRVVKNVLDNDGDLSIVQSKKNSNYGYWNYADSFTYTAAGVISSMQLGNGKWESTILSSRLQPTQIALGTVKSGTDKLKLNFDYGTTSNNGNIVTQSINVPDVGTTTGFTAIQTYTYNSLNQLKSATENITQGQTTSMSWRQTYVYDRYGNRSFDEGSDGGQFLTTSLPRNCGTPPIFTVCPVDNPRSSTTNNRLNGFTFDNSGNMTEDPMEREFTYDAENKQILIKNSFNNKIGEYFYDSSGRRVKKIEYTNNVATQATIFIYNVLGKLVAEYATNVAPSQTAQVSYLTTDHLGSPRITTDKDGKIFSRRDFMPFGEEITSAATAQRNVNLYYGEDQIRQKFTGYEKDLESGLDFAQNRYFSGKHGRFTSVDPANEGTNLYAYVGNNPINKIDPSGLSECSAEYGYEQCGGDDLYWNGIRRYGQGFGDNYAYRARSYGGHVSESIAQGLEVYFERLSNDQAGYGFITHAQQRAISLSFLIFWQLLDDGTYITDFTIFLMTGSYWAPEYSKDGYYWKEQQTPEPSPFTDKEKRSLGKRFLYGAGYRKWDQCVDNVRGKFNANGKKNAKRKVIYDNGSREASTGGVVGGLLSGVLKNPIGIIAGTGVGILGTALRLDEDEKAIDNEQSDLIRATCGPAPPLPY